MMLKDKIILYILLNMRRIILIFFNSKNLLKKMILVILKRMFLVVLRNYTNLWDWIRILCLFRNPVMFDNVPWWMKVVVLQRILKNYKIFGIKNIINIFNTSMNIWGTFCSKFWVIIKNFKHQQNRFNYNQKIKCVIKLQKQ